jgi:hypothetical protein
MTLLTISLFLIVANAIGIGVYRWLHSPDILVVFSTGGVDTEVITMRQWQRRLQ